MKISTEVNAQTPHPIIMQVKQEFQEHVATQPTIVYQPPGELAEAFSRLVRALENKRQIGALTASEANWLKEIDSLLGEISSFNLKTVDSTPKIAQEHNIYNLNSGKMLKEEEISSPPAVPKISEEEAQKIIETIDEQFAEKVLGEMKKDPQIYGKDPDTVQNFGITSGPDSAGRNLNDYLSLVKTAQPVKPFMDEDSHTDLSKIKKKRTQHALQPR